MKLPKGAAVAGVALLLLLLVGGGGGGSPAPKAEEVPVPPPGVQYLGDALRAEVVKLRGETSFVDILGAASDVARAVSMEYETELALDPALAGLLNREWTDRSENVGALAWYVTQVAPAEHRLTLVEYAQRIADTLAVEGGGPPEDQEVCDPPPDFDALIPDIGDIDFGKYKLTAAEGVAAIDAWKRIVSGDHCMRYRATPVLPGGFWLQGDSGLMPTKLVLQLAAEVAFEVKGEDPTSWNDITSYILLVNDLVLV